LFFLKAKQSSSFNTRKVN